MGGRKPRPRRGAVGKNPPRKLYRMGDLVRHTGLSRQALHRYITLGLITEDGRTESGHRLFGEGVFARLGRIEEMKRSKTLEEIAAALRGRGGTAGTVPESR